MKNARVAVRTMKALEVLADDVKVLKQQIVELRTLIIEPGAVTGQMEKPNPGDELEKALEQPVQIKPKRGRRPKSKI